MNNWTSWKLWRVVWIELAFFRIMRWLDKPTVKAFLDIFGFDISKWQGVVDFLKMKLYGAKFLILRCAYGIRQDERFTEYMANSEPHFPYIHVYAYYDPYYSPIEQANKVIAVLAAYKNRVKRVWLDLEFTWTGNYEAPQHWKTFRDLIAVYYPVGWYTRATWWDSRVGTYADIFGKDPFWVAQYNYILNLIPKGAKTIHMWQKGTPAVGLEAGVSSLEIDLDIWNDEYSLAAEFGTPTPPVEEDGMKGTMKNFTVNVRDSAGVIVTQLKLNDVVYGTVYTDNRERIRFTKIYRAAGNIENLGKECNAVTNDAAPVPVYYMALTNESEPVPEPPPAVTEDVTIIIQREGWKDLTLTGKQEKLP